MKLEELEKRIEENSIKIEKNLKKIEENLDKINNNSKKIQKNTFALEFISDYKRDKKILIGLLICTLTLWITTLLLFHIG